MLGAYLHEWKLMVATVCPSALTWFKDALNFIINTQMLHLTLKFCNI